MHRKLKSSPRTEQATAAAIASRPVRFRSQAVALKMAPTKHDPVLRFFDACPAYKQHVDATERWLVGGLRIVNRHCYSHLMCQHVPDASLLRWKWHGMCPY